jgi:hypothetical protein
MRAVGWTLLVVGLLISIAAWDIALGGDDEEKWHQLMQAQGTGDWEYAPDGSESETRRMSIDGRLFYSVQTFFTRNHRELKQVREGPRRRETASWDEGAKPGTNHWKRDRVLVSLFGIWWVPQLLLRVTAIALGLGALAALLPRPWWKRSLALFHRRPKMRMALFTALALGPIGLSGCGPSAEHDAVCKDFVAASNERNALFRGIKDEKSAREAASRLREVNERIAH